MASLDHCEQQYFLKQRPKSRGSNVDPALTQHCELKLEPKRGVEMEPGAGWLPEGVNYPPGEPAGGDTQHTCHLMPGCVQCRLRSEKLVLHISLVTSRHLDGTN